MSSSLSPLQKYRLQYLPTIPDALKNMKMLKAIEAKTGLELKKHPSELEISFTTIADFFPLSHRAPFLKFTKGKQALTKPLRVGVVLSGGQAAGGHNVISGIFDALKSLNPASELIGFLNGPSGIIKDQTTEITAPLIEGYRNQGGFDLIGSGRTKIETSEQLKTALEVVLKHKLDGLIIIGGDDSNTNAALLAEYFLARQCETSVVGVPKTIDGDLKNKDIEISFGFDSASKNYSETIGSLMRDVFSAKKYYCFIKLMGRSASHITLECALQTHPNLTFISEEVAAQKSSLKQLVGEVCNLICQRASNGKDYGVVLIPEGLVEFIPEVKCLIVELNGLLAESTPHYAALENLKDDSKKIEYIEKLLSKDSVSCFRSLPKDNKLQLLIGRDSHGNVQVSKIETERMMIEMVKEELYKRTKKGDYQGTFSPLSHFCGYEGRACLPSNFDCQYCYALGMTAVALIKSEATGYICCLSNLTKRVEDWIPGGIPLTSMMAMETRHGTAKPVITKALVDLNGKPFEVFSQQRARWAQNDDYVNPGPTQFFGPEEITDALTLTLKLEAIEKQDKT